MNPQVTGLVTRARSGDKQAWDALVERYAPLIWSICLRYGLSRADAINVGRTKWLRLVDQLVTVRDATALPRWIATATEQECRRVPCAARTPHATGQGIAEQDLYVAERNTALREAFSDLPPTCQQRITMLIEDPPMRHPEIGATAGVPAWSAGPARGHCLDRLRQSPAVAALINTKAASAADEARAMPVAL